MYLDATRWQELNQLLSQQGLPAMLLDRTTSGMAAAMDENISGPGGFLDTHPIARAVAGEMVRRCRAAEVTYDTRWCGDFDETKPETMARYFLLPYGATTLIPLEEIGQWEEVTDALYPEPKCDVHILHECYRLRSRGEYVEAETVALKRGEILCVFNICILCREALPWIKFGSPEYSGPFPWNDDGKRGNQANDDDDDDPDFPFAL